MVAARHALDAIGASPDATGCGEVGCELFGAASLESARPGDLSFCTAAGPRAEERLRASRASMLIVDASLLQGMAPGALRAIVVRSANARLDFIRVLRRCFAPAAASAGIHPSAVISPGAIIGERVTIGPHCTIAEEVTVGAGAVLHAAVHIYARVRIGAGVTIHAGSVIGADGYGYERSSEGVLERFPHLGGVAIEDDVEIGSNVSIDRGALEDTRIGPRARIDNLVHIAHNVDVGADAAIIANAVICGSVKIGERAWVAPSAVVREGISVGAGAVVGIGAVVTVPVGEGVVVAGNPARELRRSAGLARPQPRS